MMALAWGFFVPLGVMAARFFKAHNGWMCAHQLGVFAALNLVCMAWIIGIGKISDGRHPGHRNLGITVMVGLMGQVLAALLRTGRPPEGRKRQRTRRNSSLGRALSGVEQKPKKKFCKKCSLWWRYAHRWNGRVLYVLAMINVFFGLSYYNTTPGTINEYTKAFLYMWAGVMSVGLGLEVRAYYIRRRLFDDVTKVAIDTEAMPPGGDGGVGGGVGVGGGGGFGDVIMDPSVKEDSTPIDLFQMVPAAFDEKTATIDDKIS